MAYLTPSSNASPPQSLETLASNYPSSLYWSLDSASCIGPWLCFSGNTMALLALIMTSSHPHSYTHASKDFTQSSFTGCSGPTMVSILRPLATISAFVHLASVALAPQLQPSALVSAPPAPGLCRAVFSLPPAHCVPDLCRTAPAYKPLGFHPFISLGLWPLQYFILASEWSELGVGSEIGLGGE